MNRLLSIELQKIWKNRASKVLTITYFVLLTCIALFASIKFDIGPFKLHLAKEGIFNFPYIWHFNSWIAVLGKVFFAVVIVSMMANEYSYGTLKQNLIDGLNKKEFILSKFYTIILFSVISTIFVFIISLILGMIFSSYNEIEIIFSDLEYLFAYFINLLGFFSFCLFLGILVKRSAFALGFLFVWFIFEVILVYVIRDFPTVLEKFLPLEAMSLLIIEPFSRLNIVKTVGSQVGVEEIRDYSVHPTNIIIVLAWTAIFIFLSYKIIQKRDL